MDTKEVERHWREMHVSELDRRENEFRNKQYSAEALPVIEKVLADRRIELESWRAAEARIQRAEAETEAKESKEKPPPRLVIAQIFVLPVVGMITLLAAVAIVSYGGSTLAGLLVPSDFDPSPIVEKILTAGIMGAAVGFVSVLVLFAVLYANSFIKGIFRGDRQE